MNRFMDLTQNFTADAHDHDSADHRVIPLELNAQIEIVCGFASLGSKIMENDG